MTVLTERTLARLSADVARPQYDRRSHQAVYLDTPMNRGVAMDWGICGIVLQRATRLR